MNRRTKLLSWLLAAAGCSGGGIPTGPSPVAAELEFHYQSTVEQRMENLGCNGVTRIYPSWWGFTHAAMIRAGEGEWVALFEEVPVGHQTVRIEPPAGCDVPGLTANGVPLSAAEGGMSFSFTVHYDGSVTP